MTVYQGTSFTPERTAAGYALFRAVRDSREMSGAVRCRTSITAPLSTSFATGRL